jgi:hypothetical protein
MIFHDANVVFDDKRFPSVSLAIYERHARYRYLNSTVANRPDGGDFIIVGREELEDGGLFRLTDLGHHNVYRFIAVDPFADLKIKA